MVSVDLTPFRSLYPWQGKHLEVRPGIRLHYLDEGRGEPLLLLHGNPTWSFHYRRLVSAFSGSHRVIAPDHVGCGLSDKPDDRRYDYVLESRIQDVERLVEHLDLQGITLVVHDWGGMIGVAFALRHLQRIRRLVLMNTAAFGLPPGKILPWQIGIIRHLPGFSLPIRGFNAFVLGALRTCVVHPLGPAERAGYLAPYSSWKERIAIQRFVEDIPLEPRDRSYGTVQAAAAELHRLRDVPTLIAWGGKDYVFDDDFLAEWRRHLPGAEVHRFADAGHWVLEDAHEEIIPLLRDFLSRGESAVAEALP